MYVPITLVLTSFTVTILDVRFPSLESTAIAPESVYVDGASMVTLALPFNAITGSSVSTLKLALVTCVAAFPARSLTSAVTA